MEPSGYFSLALDNFRPCALYFANTSETPRAPGAHPDLGGNLMITALEMAQARQRAHEYLAHAGIVLTPEESASIEVADFGLGDLAHTGLELVVYINTERCCAKELVLFPRQTCPEHCHPPVGDDPGKEETFRCRWGEVYLYVAGEPTPAPRAVPPAGRKAHYTVWR